MYISPEAPPPAYRSHPALATYPGGSECQICVRERVGVGRERIAFRQARGWCVRGGWWSWAGHGCLHGLVEKRHTPNVLGEPGDGLRLDGFPASDADAAARPSRASGVGLGGEDLARLAPDLLAVTPVRQVLRDPLGHVEHADLMGVSRQLRARAAAIPLSSSLNDALQALFPGVLFHQASPSDAHYSAFPEQPTC